MARNKNARSNCHEARAHFGVDYTYTKRSVTKTIAALTWLNPITKRAAKLIKTTPANLKQILATWYPKGSGIGWHRDAEFSGDAVIGISFSSDCTMKFKNPDTNEIYKLFIPRRSAYVFSGKARWRWLRSISKHENALHLTGVVGGIRYGVPSASC